MPDDNTTDNAAGGGVGEVRCECDHLTDFIVVKAPTSWDEFMQSALEGFEVHVFSWLGLGSGVWLGCSAYCQGES